MPSITDGHSLFATSSAPCTMAVAYASVAWRLLAQTSGGTWGLPRFLIDPTGWQASDGVRDVLSAARVGEPTVIDDGQRPTWCLLWLQLPDLHQETSVSCLMITTVQSNVHICFPYPLPQHSPDLLFSQDGRPSQASHAHGFRPLTQNVYPQLRTPQLLATHVQLRSLRSGSGFVIKQGLSSWLCSTL